MIDHVRVLWASMGGARDDQFRAWRREEEAHFPAREKKKKGEKGNCTLPTQTHFLLLLSLLESLSPSSQWQYMSPAKNAFSKKERALTSKKEILVEMFLKKVQTERTAISHTVSLFL